MNKFKDFIRPIAIWLAYYGILYLFFEGRFSTEVTLVSSFTLWLLHLIIAYTNTMVLIPRYYQNKKYIVYTFLCIILLLLLIPLFDIIVAQLIDFEPLLKNRPITERPRRGFGLRPLVPIAWLSILMLLITTLYSVIKLNNLREKEATLLKSENLTSELNFLRSQINPHFLFNAMNNLYALSIDNSPYTSDMILKLSAMLRYNIYDAENEQSSVSKEIEYLTNYIEFFKVRLEQPERIVMTSNIDRSYQISPMLLIPFVENAIKHSKIENDANAHISIFLESTASKLEFKVVNSRPSSPHQKDNVGGIGIKNVKRRLELLYKDRYELSIHEAENEYSIDLTILL